MKNQVKVFAVPHENTGVGWYRVIQPLQYLAKQKKINVHSTFFSGDMSPQPVSQAIWEENGEWCDIVYTTSAKTREQCAVTMACRDVYKKKLVVDLDDHVTALNPDHPNYDSFMQGNVSVWAQKSIEHADLFVTTNTYLALQYSSVNKNVFVMPNAVDLRHWNSFPKEKKVKHKGKVRIGWVGAAGHERDLKILQKPLEDLRYKYGRKIEFVSIGQQPIIVDVDDHLGFYSLDVYPEAYQKANFDIILAPMADSGYNRSKSNLRLLEASAQKIPVVASPVGEYKDFPCLYAKEPDEWVEQVSRLVDSSYERARVGLECYNVVEQKFDISVVAPQLLTKLEELHRQPWVEKHTLKG